MNTHHRNRFLRLFSSLIVAVAIAAPVATAKNDYGPTSVSTAQSSTVLNDTVHNRVAEAAAQQSPEAIVVRADGGFDWISAAAGAAGGFGLLLVLGVAAVALRRREHIGTARA